MPFRPTLALVLAGALSFAAGLSPVPLARAGGVPDPLSLDAEGLRVGVLVEGTGHEAPLLSLGAGTADGAAASGTFRLEPAPEAAPARLGEGAALFRLVPGERERLARLRDTLARWEREDAAGTEGRFALSVRRCAAGAEGRPGRVATWLRPTRHDDFVALSESRGALDGFAEGPPACR
jgi:hypothetical protein